MERDKFYEKSADIVIDVVGNKDTDLANLLKVIGFSNNDNMIKPIELMNKNKDSCR